LAITHQTVVGIVIPDDLTISRAHFKTTQTLIQSMKCLIHALAAALALATSAFAQDKPKLPSKTELLEAIETFSKAPLSPEGKAAGDKVLLFMGDTRGTNYADLRLFPELSPGTQRDAPDKVKKAIGTLLRARIAGNLRPQLQSGVITNQPYAEVQQMLKTYAQLKKADPTLRLPNVEKLADLEAKGQLKQFVGEIEKKKSQPKK
jgi:hypothetical protein